MPGNTSKHRIPYPLASERVADYPTIARQAAEKVDTLLPKQQRAGKVTISSVGRLTYQNFTVTFNTPMPSTDYTIVLCLGGSGAYSPELMRAVYKTDNKRTNGFEGRVRNDGNSAQPCEVSYLVIEN